MLLSLLSIAHHNQSLIPLLKSSHTLVVEYQETEFDLSRNFPLCGIEFIVLRLRDALQVLVLQYKTVRQDLPTDPIVAREFIG